MEWNDLPDSHFSALLKSKALAHPTNADFDETAWTREAMTATSLSKRDRELLFAAIHYGGEIASLRENKIPSVTSGFSRARLVRLAAAHVNQQYLMLMQLALRQMKARQKKGGIFDFEREQQQFVANVGGQEMTPDDHVAYLVDSLPHWLFHIWQISENKPVAEPGDVATFAGQAMQVASIEHSLRHLWLSSLWSGNAIQENAGDVLLEGPTDRYLAERWFVWDLRQTMLLGSEHSIDAGIGIVAGGKLPPIKPALERTVIRVEWPQSEHRRFIIGAASGAKPEQRAHVTEADMLKSQYTGLFIDELLPKSPNGNFTCRELNNAWWVLQDLARVAASDLGKAAMTNDKAVGRFAITVERKDLVSVLSDCLAIDPNRAVGIVDWLTGDPTKTGQMFSKSFWSQPLLPDPDSEKRHVLLAPLLAGAPLKRIEAWMERGGISDSEGVKGRGKPFEKHVRGRIAEALSGNDLLSDAAISEHGLKRRGQSEEIDLLVRVGNIVLVGEVKCFVAPSEPLEKFNHLRSLKKATEQCAKKRAWAEENKRIVAEAVGVSDPLQIEKLQMVPAVILNNTMGVGLERDGVPIVDLHYLNLLFTANRYRSGARFERGVGIFSEYVDLYTSQADLEARFFELLRAPPPLDRYNGALRWRQVPFPTSSGKEFHIELPALLEEPLPNPLRDLPYSGMHNRKKGGWVS